MWQAGLMTCNIPPLQGIHVTADQPYINREIAELEYHARLLDIALDSSRPLLSRIRFCGLFTNLTDEFFRVRIAGLHAKARQGDKDAAALAARLRQRFSELARTQSCLWHKSLVPELAAAGLVLTDYAGLSKDQKKAATGVFDREFFPILTPLAIGPAHPFPFISDLSVSLAVRLQPHGNSPQFARVKVPQTLPRFVPLDGNDGTCTFIRSENLIGAHLERLFPGRDIRDWHAFRVTRDADYDIEDIDIEDLRSEVESELHDRQFGDALRLEVEAATPPDVVSFLRSHLSLASSDVLPLDAPLGLRDLHELHSLHFPELKYPEHTPVQKTAFSTPEVFDTLREKDLLIHHPYETFESTTRAFIETAAEDPRVLSIKQTLYRTGDHSPIVEAMTRAAALGKQCVMLVELKARFDEEDNLHWATTLQKAGVHVVHGFVELKTHTKTAVVVRRDEDDVIRLYGHIATGNYNADTAKIYEDISLFTSEETLTDDLSHLFNLLTSGGNNLHPNRLLTAPTTLLPRLLELIHTQAHPGGRIILKVNHIAHQGIMDALVEAGKAGASIDLIVRTTPCLIPGIEGATDNIRVKSVVGHVLEHSRIYCFGEDPEPGAFLIGSADLMDANLTRRVDTLVPIEDPHHRDYLRTVLDELLADETWSWTLGPDASWTKTPGTRDAQDRLLQAAINRA